MHFNIIFILAMLGLHAAAASSIQATQSQNVDFNALLDGTLGSMPAMLLATHGALAALNSTAPSLALRSETSSATDTSTAPANRDKENGAVMGSFIGAALLAPIRIQDGGVLTGICQTLVAGATAMGATVVGQEAGKGIYPHNSTAPDFEQGPVPGASIGGAFGVLWVLNWDGAFATSV